jgi:transposase InsO family protein
VAQLSSLPIGPATKGQEKRIVVNADLCRTGGKHTFRALIDNGAQLNLISQRVVRELDMEGLDLPKPTAKYLNDQRLQIHKAHDLKLSVVDEIGKWKRKSQRFWGADIGGYDLILGWDWLEAMDPLISFTRGTFMWNEKRSDEKMSREKKDLFLAAIENGEVGIMMEDGTTIGAALDEGENPLDYVDVETAKPVRIPWETYAARNSRDQDPTCTPTDEPWYVGAIAQYDQWLKATQAPTTETEGLPKVYQEYADVFSEEGAAILARHGVQDHAIDLEPHTMPPQLGLYNLSQDELRILREYLDAALKKGWIRHSKSPSAAPILFVPKKDGAHRLCVDYRGLNKITIKNRYPLPLISELLDRLGHAKIFSKLDLRDAYHRLRIKEGDEWKTAFKTRYGLFEYMVMPFGLANAPATFQAYIHKALGHLVDSICIVYLDDILIYSKNEEEHVKHVKMVLQRLRDYALFAKPSKCTFHTEEVEFLGFVVTTDGVTMDAKRVRSIREWPAPTTHREVQVFLGFANFYRRFVWNYSALARPLNKLLAGGEVDKSKKKNRVIRGPFKWGPAEQESFDALRNAFTSAPLLRHFDPALPIMVITDASDAAQGGILLQPSEEDPTQKHWHPVAYHSKSFTQPEVRYNVFEKELTAISECFKVWRHYLEGSTHVIRVQSDHHNLQSVMKPGYKLTARSGRIAERLAVFDFQIEYKKGSTNPADGLSRRPDYFAGFKEGTKHDALQGLLPMLQQKLQVKEFQDSSELAKPLRFGRDPHAKGVSVQNPRPDPAEKVIASVFQHSTAETIDHTCCGDLRPVRPRFVAGTEGGHLLVSRIAAAMAAQDETALDPSPESLLDFIREVQQKDAFVKNLVAEPAAGYEQDAHGLVRFNGKVVVPRSASLRNEILMRNHDDQVAGGHYGVARTVELIARKYHWKGLTPDVKTYIKECDVCQRVKPRHHKPYGELQPLPIPYGPWKHLSMDFVTGLPASKGFDGRTYDSVLVVVDRFSKYVRYIPCGKDIDASALAELFMNRVVLDAPGGCPDSLITDRGSVFTSAFWATFCHCLRVKHRMSTAFHPQTDGQTERLNQQLEAHLRIYCSYEQENWAMLLYTAQFAHNTKVHAGSHKSPCELSTGVQPGIPDGVPEVSQIDQDLPLRGGARDDKLKRSAREFLANRLSDFKIAREHLEHAQKLQSKYHNRTTLPKHFDVGEKVLLSARNIQTRRPHRKLDSKWFGPFEIKNRKGMQAYELVLPPGMQRLHPTFHVSLLEPYHARAGYEPGPVPMLLDVNEYDDTDVATGQHYEIEKIVAHKHDREGPLFRARWLGWSQEHDEWFRESDLEAAEEVLQAYKAAHPDWAKAAGISHANRSTNATLSRPQRVAKRQASSKVLRNPRK